MRDAPGREPPPDPWFIRAFEHVTRTVLGFRWWLPRAYLRIWRRLSVPIFPPCLSVEEARGELAGIAIVRVLAGLPGFYLLLRPVLWWPPPAPSSPPRRGSPPLPALPPRLRDARA
jgi:hypothetical protein